MRKAELDIGDGWKFLAEPLVKIVEDNGGTVLQVKEKFGMLRFYYSAPYEDGGSGEPYEGSVWEAIDAMVRAAENISQFVCEYSGTPGELRTTNPDGSPRYWMKTMSDGVWLGKTQ